LLIWTLAALLMVVGVKYYTSLEMKKLERRLETVKDGLQQAKDRHKTTQNKQEETEAEEAGQAERIRIMKEIIQDQQDRLGTAQELSVDKVISDSMPPNKNPF
jgi:F0F1-type ATP synthase membrane subunit b/b'